MNEEKISAHMNTDQFKFLDRCADFYSEVVNIKRANAEGRLAAYLVLAEKVAASPNEIARQLSARLENILRQQHRDFKRDGTADERHIHQVSLYLMAALVDEIFILEMPWQDPRIGDAWLDVLLEQKLFKTSDAGSRFFSIAQRLIRKPKSNLLNGPNPLNGELAAVMLMALELGFKGCYRGRQGQLALQKIRAQLYQIVKQSYPHSLPVDPNKVTEPWSAFAQAYQYPLYNGKDARLAPLSPWKNLSLYAVVGYLVLSTLCWLVLIHSFEKYISH